MKTILWAKTMKNNRLVNDVVLTLDDYQNEELSTYMKDICYKMDLETPILLSKHYKYIDKYNAVKFIKDDFVDYIDFDCLLVEKSEGK